MTSVCQCVNMQLPGHYRTMLPLTAQDSKWILIRIQRDSPRISKGAFLHCGEQCVSLTPLFACRVLMAGTLHLRWLGKRSFKRALPLFAWHISLRHLLDNQLIAEIWNVTVFYCDSFWTLLSMEESDNRCGEGVVGWGGTGLAIQERLIKDRMTQRKWK